jgi:hypothetical protein
MDPPASFSSLPPELVAKICGDSGLKKKDLIALRLSSKIQGVHASATKAFAKRYFTDVLLLHNKYSLETFVKISQHSVFGPSVRKVQLSCAHYDEEKFYDTVDTIREGLYGRQTFLEQIQRVSERCDDECYSPVHASALLKQAFDELAKSDHDLVLAVSTDEEKSLGRSKTYVSDMFSEDWWAEPSSALTRLLNAADASGRRVRKIEVQATSECHLGDHGSDYSEKSELLRSVSELKFDLWTTCGEQRCYRCPIRAYQTAPGKRRNDSKRRV